MLSKKMDAVFECRGGVEHVFDSFFGVLTVLDHYEDVTDVIFEEFSALTHKQFVFEKRARGFEQIHNVRKGVLPFVVRCLGKYEPRLPKRLI
jgi:hypothetical protein